MITPSDLLKVHYTDSKTKKIVKTIPLQVYVRGSSRFFRRYENGETKFYYESGEEVLEEQLPQDLRDLPPMKTKQSMEEQLNAAKLELAQLKAEKEAKEKLLTEKERKASKKGELELDKTKAEIKSLKEK